MGFLGLAKQTTLDGANARIEELEAGAALAVERIAALQSEVDRHPAALAEERTLRVNAERAAGKQSHELTARLNAAVAENGVLAARITDLEADIAAAIANRASDREVMHAKWKALEEALDRERTANAALIKEHDKTLAKLTALRQELAAAQTANDALEAAQARIRREHEQALAAEVAAHAATKLRIEANAR